MLMRQLTSNSTHSSNSRSKFSSNSMKETVVLVNTYILDTADLLWRMRAFSHQRPPPPSGARTYLDTFPQSVLQSTDTPHCNVTGSLLTHRAFIGFAMAFIDKVSNFFILNWIFLYLNHIFLTDDFLKFQLILNLSCTAKVKKM